VPARALVLEPARVRALVLVPVQVLVPGQEQALELVPEPVLGLGPHSQRQLKDQSRK